MQGNQHVKIENDPYMPLTIELIGEPVDTPFGIGLQYSLCHYYKQFGDLVQDPEMCFLLIDNRENDFDNWEKVDVIPYMYQNGNLGIYQESIEFIDGKIEVINQKQQVEHRYFAGHWLRNIWEQGFLTIINSDNEVQFSD